MFRLFALICIVATAVPAPACMGVGREPVRFAGQTNIVVWDAAHGIEHFVRDARFVTGGTSLGFIAPSPTQPQIEGAKASAFARLAALAPDAPQMRGGGGSAGGGGMGGRVSVIERKIVAGYEATVLRASDPQALAAWMNANGYPTPAYAARWTAPYVRAGWYLTAFKVAAEGGAGATGPVRMSFRTDAPFNPYYVTEENAGRGGLSLYYVSAGREEAKIGRIRPWVAPRWRAILGDANSRGLSSDLGVEIPRDAAVTFYRDEGFGPRRRRNQASCPSWRGSG